MSKLVEKDYKERATLIKKISKLLEDRDSNLCNSVEECDEFSFHDNR